MEFSTEQTELPMNEPNIDSRFKNVKEFKASDGSFYITNGRIELRDTDGNIVVLLDANG